MTSKLRRWPTLILSLVLITAIFPAMSAESDSHAPGGNSPTAPTSDAATSTSLSLVKFTDDPIEPFNRVSYAVSDEAMDWVIVPLAKGYSFIIRRPVRESVSKFGKNLAYPVRLINTLLQGKFRGARDETGRFVVNTTVGVLGFFDPAKKWGLASHKEDFGQTFGKWGMGPGFYFFLPVTGPSSGRDAVGSVGDALANPATWIPGLSPFLSFNDLTFRVDDYERLTNSQSDPYFLLREAWSVVREKDVVDYTIPPEAYQSSGPSLAAAMAFLEVRNPDFRHRVKRREVLIAATGRKLPYSIWPREDTTDLVFILPGVGSHRDSGLSHAAAEMIYEAGYTPVSLSSPFNWEFIDNAATSAVPGYTPFDVADVERALDAIFADVNERAGGRYNRVGVVGLSLGGLHALFLATESGQDPLDARRQTESTDPRPPYERFIAISPPIDPLYALQTLDHFYRTPVEWPEATRDQRIEETLFRAAVVAERGLADLPGLPFDEAEAQFLIGMGYRNVLHNAIFASQRRRNLGVLKTPYRWSSRKALYEEIWNLGYSDYMERFVLPYVQKESQGEFSRDQWIAAAGLRSIEDSLASDDRVRVVVNHDDFVMKPEDRQWLERTFDSRLIHFEEGGHLGGLYREEAKEALGRLFDPAPLDPETSAVIP